MRRGYPVIVNAEEQTDFAADVARAVSGDCADAPLVMGGEDFAYMSNARPGRISSWAMATRPM